MDIDKVTTQELQRLKKWVEDNYPLGRYGQPEDVAKVTFLNLLFINDMLCHIMC